LVARLGLNIVLVPPRAPMVEVDVPL